MKGQKRRMSAGYPPARPDNWPGGQYTNPNAVPQGSGSLSQFKRQPCKREEWKLSGRNGESSGGRTAAMGCNDGKIKFARGESWCAPNLPRAWD
jgi:hypothetical protein